MADNKWATPEAITKRIGMLADYYSFKLYNNALKLTAKTSGEKTNWWFKTMQDDHVCDLCTEYEDRVYASYEFMPVLPKHFGCRCAYELVPQDILPEVTEVYLPY